MSEAEALDVPHGKVGWFELFYDLVIVAAVGYAAHTFAEHPSWGLGFWIAAWTLIMFVLWSLTSLHHNLFPADSPTRRYLILAQMLGLVVAALGSVADEGLSNATGFAAFTVTFGSVAAMYLMTARGDDAHARTSAIIGWSSAAGALVLATGAWLPDDASWTLDGWPLWILAVGVGIAAVPLVLVIGRVSDDLDRGHLSERLGQLVIIVLGESFMSLVTALGGRSTIPNPLFFVITFLVVFAIWTLYFSSVLPAGPPRTVGRLRIWLLAHWLLIFGAVAAAAGFSAVTLVPFGARPVEVGSEWTTMPLAIVMASMALLTWLGSPALRGLVRLHLATTAVLLLLAVIGITVTPGGEGWEIVAGSVLIMVDAVVSVRITRPYAVSRSVAGTRSSGSGPSPS